MTELHHTHPQFRLGPEPSSYIILLFNHLTTNRATHHSFLLTLRTVCPSVLSFHLYLGFSSQLAYVSNQTKPTRAAFVEKGLPSRGTCDRPILVQY